MSNATSTSQESAMIYANINLTIFEAAEQKSILLAALGNAPDTLEVNLSAVDEIDSAGIQLLLFLKQEAQRQQKTVSYSQHSTATLNAIELLNLAGQLGDPLLIPKGEQA
ncbi:lipid asymmetry maintenance protein MlaB [Chitinibacter sp. S2-10]|uniref:STAS domain-containing protein n=1 Tax=Chitinibacter sp. S2-10 TaxID=3373597 RepID=UPI0039779877